ncbi:MAG: hypothetical protein H3Z54_05670 [archaeon]|nr:hypothetical protein [archaeon]
MEECRNLGLRASGAERTAGLYGEDYLPLFDCRLKINEKIFETQIIGLPIPIPIVGMDVLRNYRLIIDWKTQIGEAEET